MRHQLVLFFNEDYSKNVPVLERLYGSRFSNRMYIVPDHHSRFERDYRSRRDNYRTVNRRDRLFCKARRFVGKTNLHELEAGAGNEQIARVTGFKYYLQDYFWQARRSLIASDADWYWFVSDDVLIHPGINEGNILDRLVNSVDAKSLICQPHYAREEWVDKFHGSLNGVVATLRGCKLYPNDIRPFDLRVDPIETGKKTERIIAGYSDFFGCRRDLLEAALSAYHKLAVKKIFVEVAIPNSLLTLDPESAFLNNFEWDYSRERGSLERVKAYLDSPDGGAFYHPAKISQLGAARFIEAVL